MHLISPHHSAEETLFLHFTTASVRISSSKQTHGSTMLPTVSVLLLCLLTCSESSVISQAPGENITLECSSDGCPQSTDGYDSLYLYHEFHEENEVLFVSTDRSQKISERRKHRGRIQSGSPSTFTITNLTVDDSGIYKCVYKKSVTEHVKCRVYAVVVSERTPCSSPAPTVTDTMLLYVVFACVVGALMTWIFVLLIVPRVKEACRQRRRSRRVSNDYVYEDMRKNSSPPLANADPSFQPM